MAQETLSTFNHDVAAVTLQPGEINGCYTVTIAEKEVFDRKEYAGLRK